MIILVNLILMNNSDHWDFDDDFDNSDHDDQSNLDYLDDHSDHDHKLRLWVSLSRDRLFSPGKASKVILTASLHILLHGIGPYCTVSCSFCRPNCISFHAE